MSTHDYFIYGDEDFRIAGDRSTRSNVCEPFYEINFIIKIV